LWSLLGVSSVVDLCAHYPVISLRRQVRVLGRCKIASASLVLGTDLTNAIAINVAVLLDSIQQ